MGKQALCISHLMFTDDLLLIGEAKESHMQCIMEILKTFRDMSRLKISEEKSRMLFSKNAARSVKLRIM